MTSIVKRLVRAPFRIAGYDIVRRDAQAPFPTWISRLSHAQSLGFTPHTIIDGGAFQGVWASEVAHLFPGSRLVLVEPNPNLRDAIARNVAGIEPPPTVVEAALGEAPGRASLNIWRDRRSDAGASLLRHVSGPATVTAPVDVDTLDAICDRLQVRPDLIKLDLQGMEGAALRGGSRAMASAEMMLVEFGCLEAYVERTTPTELLAIADANGFTLYDIVDCHYRPFDGALTGGDFLFVKRTSQLRSHRGWT